MYIAGELRRLEAKIDNGSTDWHDRHRAGVLWTEVFAVCFWYQRGSSWRVRGQEAYNMAEERLTGAHDRAENAQDTLGTIAVLCDLAMLDSICPKSNKHRRKVRTDLVGLFERLEAMLSTEPTFEQEKAIRYQLAICSDFIARINHRNGFVDNETDYSETARSLFNQLVGDGFRVDNGRAYCAYLIHAALRERGTGQLDASRARMLAANAGRRGQAFHARMVLMFGAAGERMVQYARYWYVMFG